MDLSIIFKSLEAVAKRIVMYLFIIFSFWSVSLYLFKPEILNGNILIPLFLNICFSILWLIIYYFITTFYSIGSNYNNITVRLELTTVIAITLKALFIIIGYYYSFYFTQYLRFVFGFSAVLLLISLLYGLIGRARKVAKSKITK